MSVASPLERDELDKLLTLTSSPRGAIGGAPEAHPHTAKTMNTDTVHTARG